MKRARATTIGFVAVLLWALLALFTVWSAPVPPLLLNSMCFAIGGTCGLAYTALTTGLGVLRKVPLAVYLFGTLGLFGYHALYFSALRLAPAAEAGLIAYLWPLLIVIGSGLLPGEKVAKGHLIGVVVGFAGAALIISGGGSGLDWAHLPGYLLALICAFTWSSYSVLSRLVGTAPTQSVSVFCLASAVLSLPLHFAFEETVLPPDAGVWLAVGLLGLGPVGLAFFVWDIGVKRGDIQLLGAASYAAPLLSTLALVAAGVAPLTPSLAIAALLVTGGAAIAARASWSHAS
ncbi:MAG: EamA family transporter [Pseudomonadota bacterium]